VSDPAHGTRRRPQGRPRGRSRPECRCPLRGPFVRKIWSQIGRDLDPGRHRATTSSRNSRSTSAVTAAGIGQERRRGSGGHTVKNTADNSAFADAQAMGTSRADQRRRPPRCVPSSMAFMWVRLSCSMVVLRCTQYLLFRIKHYDDEPLTGSTTRLGDWYGTLLRVGRRHALLFTSERSRLSVLLPVRHADRLASTFSAAVSEMLAAIGVPSAAIEQERSLMSPIRFGSTRSRSVLGSLNDFSLLARMHFITKRDDPLEIIARGPAEVPVMPMKGKHPSAVTRRLFEVD